ncbi:hypothetical protein GCM10027046_23850 [Uliginosibacterium flavum]
MYSLKEGSLEKEVRGSLSNGTERSISVTLADLSQRLREGNPSREALVLGQFADTDGAAQRFTTKSRATDGGLTRSRECIHWSPCTGLLGLDLDDSNFNSANEVRQAIVKLFPEFEAAGILVVSSSSSFISEGNTSLTSGRGWHVFIMLKNQSDISRLALIIKGRCWLADQAKYKVGKVGQALVAAQIDFCVFQPERLWYSFGAEMGVGLEQHRVIESFHHEASPLDTSCIADLTPTEHKQIEAIKRRERDKITSECGAKRAEWSERTARQMMDRGTSYEIAKETTRVAVVHQVLTPDFVLTTQDGQQILVSNLLENPKQWHGRYFHDPLEPEYRDGKGDIAVFLCVDGRCPVIYSHAHGGTKYRLQHQRTTVVLHEGEYDKAERTCAKSLGLTGEWFWMNESLVSIDGGGNAKRASLEQLRLLLENLCVFKKHRAGGNEPIRINAPDRLVTDILIMAGSFALPPLRNLVTGPCVLPDGRPMLTPGYDEATQTLGIQLSDQEWGIVDMQPDDAALFDALRVILGPIRLFPFSTPEDRAAFVATLATSAWRSACSTVPMAAFVAHTAGSGKTMLAELCGILGHSAPSLVSAGTLLEPDLDKLLFAKCLNGGGVVTLDNVKTGSEFGSATVSAYTTSSTISGRILGHSKTQTVANRMQIILTGNNIRVSCDNSRRCLLVRLSTNDENPALRKFPFIPTALVHKNRQAILAAFLTIYRGWKSANSPMPEDALGSFPEWDAIVRAPLAWLAQWVDQQATAGSLPIDIPTLADPIATLIDNMGTSPETERLRVLHDAWYESFGNKRTKAGDLISLWQNARCDQHGYLQPASTGELSGHTDALFDVLEQVAALNGKPNSRALGRWLAGLIGVVVAGRKLVDAGMREGSRVFSLERAGATLSEG